MYHALFIILLTFSFIEFFGKNNKVIARLLSFLLLLIVTLRYGQGSDYFSYIYLFNQSANDFETALLINDFSLVNQEIGFSLISYVFLKVLHFTPEFLSALFSLYSFILIWLCIKKYSFKPITSLLFYYCTFYLIYPFSVIRQSVCISSFIYFLIPLLQSRKYIKYYIISIILFTIHYSSIILFIIPIVNIIKNYKISHVYIISGISFIIGLIFYQFLFPFFSTIDVIAGKIEVYTDAVTLDLTSVMLRIILFIPILHTYHLYERNSIRDLFLKIYIFGFILYLLFMSSSLISSRLNVYTRHFEMILLIDFLVNFFFKKWNRILSYTFIIAIMTVLYVKNINSFIYQGPYYSHVNFINYPYVSVFNKNRIIETRNISTNYLPYLIYD